MRARGPWILPVAVLAALHLSCPRPDDAPSMAAAVPAPAPAAAPAPAPATAPAAAPAPARAPVAAPAPASGSVASVSGDPAGPVDPGAPIDPAWPDPAAPDPAAQADPASLSALPPELIDDGVDEVPDLEPPRAPAPSREVDELASTARETWIFTEPRWGSRRIGYLRAGAIVERRSKPSGWGGCPGGWYRIEPRGYVCVGATATLDVYEPVVETSARRPIRGGERERESPTHVGGERERGSPTHVGGALPYTYVMSRFPTPPLYARLPSEGEQRRAEPDLASHLRQAGATARAPDFFPPPPPEPTPGALLYDRPAPALGGAQRDEGALVLGHARVRSGFALLSTFDHEGRRFGLTTDLAVLPLDRTRVVRPSAFAGLALDGEVTLPVAFVRRRHAARFIARGAGGLARGAPLAWREAVPLTGESRRAGGVEYLAARDGALIRADEVVRVDPLRNTPAWAAAGRRWIDVSILRQSLVAYEGTRPVYVTLVSTGADGLGDPKKTHSTIQGAFLIHTKHVTVTMDGDDEDEFDFRDVPFVQYFTEGFALHAAYWHDDFGTPRSHGCVNLSPIDAAWLFAWTTPEVPPTWHAALSLKKGTLVHIHP
jgi:hypothetical protein